MVSCYCSLMFSRREIILFYEAAFVSVHCNCLISWIKILQGYQPWNTISTTMDICLLVENSNKKNKTICKVCSNFFYQPFGCTKANFESLTRRQPLFKYDAKSTKSLVIMFVPTVWLSASVRFELETFQFWM